MYKKIIADCALLSARSYPNNWSNEFKNRFKGALDRYEISEHSLSGDVEYIIAQSRELVIISFSGTESKRDAERDFNADFDMRLGFSAHDGFSKAAELFIQKAEIYKYRHKKVIFTGHSMGGAIAQLVYAFYYDQSNTQCITFGQPMCIKSDYSSYSLQAAKSTLVINCADMVVRQPMLPGYRRFGKVIYIDRKGKFHEKPSDSMMFFDRLFTFHRRIKQHSSRLYLQHFEPYLDMGVQW